METGVCSTGLSVPDSRSQFWFLRIGVVLFALLIASTRANSWQGPPQGLEPREETTLSDAGNAPIDNAAAEVGIAKKLNVTYVSPAEAEQLSESVSSRTAYQRAISEPSELVDPRKCVRELSAGDAAVSAAGGSIRVLVDADQECAWKTAADGIPWLIVNNGVADHGSGSVSFTVSRNMNTLPRMAAVTIAGEIFVVTQAGGEAQLANLRRNFK